MIKRIIIIPLLIVLNLIGVCVASWDNLIQQKSLNVLIGDLNKTISYNVSTSTSILNDINELGITYTNTYEPQIIGAYLFKNNTQYDLILYFRGFYMVDSDIFNITINNLSYSLNYTSSINSCYLNSKSYYTCELDSYYRKKIYIRNVGNIDSLKVNWVDYYYETTDDDDNYYTTDEIYYINKTINVIKGF